MAQRTVVVLEDDIDGGEAAETVTFALDGTTYEIDLNESNASRLRETLADFIGAGRRVARAGRSGSRRRPATGPSGASAQEIRAWAKDNGYSVPDRGRIPADVREAFDSAH